MATILWVYFVVAAQWGFSDKVAGLGSPYVGPEISFVDDELQRLNEEAKRVSDKIDTLKTESVRKPEASAELMGEAQKAEDQIVSRFEKLLRFRPQYSPLYTGLGDFYYSIGNEEKAEEQWNRSIRANRRNSVAYNNLANIYGHHGPIKKGFKYYEKAIRLDPENPVYFQNFATSVFLFRKDAGEYFKETEQQVFDRALSLYRSAIRIDPRNLGLLEDYAASYDGIRPYRFEEAERAWRDVQALALELDDRLSVDRAYNHIARFMVLANRLTDAQEALDQISEGPDQDPSILAVKKRLLKLIKSKSRE